MDGHLRPGTDLNRTLAVVLLVSGLLKVTLAVFFADLPPRFDEEEFLDFGHRVAAGDAPVPWRAPGYQWFLAVGLLASGGSPVGVRVAQALLSVLTTWLVWRTGRQLFGERAALAAATFVAFYPPLVAFSHLLWTETLYAALILLAFERVLASERARDVRAAATGGLLLGLAALVRSSGLVLLVASLAWLLFRGGRRALLPALALVGVCALVLAPWSLHASKRSGRVVLVDTNSGYNLWSGNNPYVPRDLQGVWGVGLPLQNGTEEAWGERLRAKGLDPAFARFLPGGDWRMDLPARMAAAGIDDVSSAAGDDYFREEALRGIRRDPTAFLARVPRRLAAFWSPDVFLPRHLLRDWYGPVPSALAAALLALTWAASAVPLLMGPAALLSLRASPFRSLLLVWLVASLAVHAATFGVSRMHEPLVPLLVLAVAAWRWGEAELVAGRRVRASGITAAGLAACGWVVALPIAVGLYVAPGPRHPGIARMLGAVRHLPLPGTRWAAWMVAGVEAARGDDAVAAGILAEPKHADDPWSLYLAALVADDVVASRRLVDAALAHDPSLRPAQLLKRALAERSP